MRNITFSDGNRCPICGRLNCYENASNPDATSFDKFLNILEQL